MSVPMSIVVRGTNRIIEVKEVRIEDQSVSRRHSTLERRGTDIAVDEVVEMIRNSAGTHFDPAIVDCVVRLHGRGALHPDDWDV